MKTLRLLVIGNSLAENSVAYLREIAASSGAVEIVLGYATLGGCPLVKHWRLAEYTRQHPEHKTYQLDTGGAAWAGKSPYAVNLQEALVAEPWDTITLNHASIPGPRRETFQPWLGFLHELVRERAPQAAFLLHQTWAYREDSSYLIENGLTSETMFERLKANYAHFAAELGCRVIPTGEAIQTFRRKRQFRFPDPGFDYQHAVAPALPRQDNSLSIGWYWSINDSVDGIPQLMLDFNHLNPAGLYLAGCTWFETLTGHDVRTVAFHPAEVDATLAECLRTIAHEVARNARREA